MDGDTKERIESLRGRASSGLPLSATDNRLGRDGRWRQGGKMGVCLLGVAPVAPVFHLLLPFFTCQQLSLLGLEDRSFSPCCATIRR